jgi:hypothetical protein
MPKVKLKKGQRALLRDLTGATEELALATKEWTRLVTAAEEAKIPDSHIARAAGLPASTYHDNKRKRMAAGSSG